MAKRVPGGRTFSAQKLFQNLVLFFPKPVQPGLEALPEVLVLEVVACQVGGHGKLLHPYLYLLDLAAVELPDGPGVSLIGYGDIEDGV